MGVLLLGYRGSGKTSVGRKLADRLWCNFVDIDEQIVARAGLSIKDIFATAGESAFRDLETSVLIEHLTHESDVISCGGGIVLREVNRDAIVSSKHSRIYLRCDPHVLLQRIESDPATALSRPALTGMGGNIDEVQSLLKEREPLYRQVMTAELDVTNLSIDEAVIRVAKLV